MYQIKSNIEPTIFLNNPKKASYNYPRNITATNYGITFFKLSTPKYKILIWDPTYQKIIPTYRERSKKGTLSLKRY